MASLNQCNFIGNATRDANLRYTASGFAMADFSIAVNDRRKNASGQYEDVAEFVNCTMLGDRAEKMSQYVTKGKPVYVEGKLQTRTWDDDQGVKHYKTEILVNNIQLLGGRDDQSGGRQGSNQHADNLPFE
jgi:single-strand DNA-binding protein